MPNWAETDMAVVMPSRNVNGFMGLFLSHDPKENEGKKEYFGRTFLNDINEEKNDHGMSCLRISCDCAWSAYSCLIEGYPGTGDDGHRCPTLKEALDRYEVKRMTLHSSEPGIGFEETATFDKDEGSEVNYESRDLYRDPWCEFCDEDEEDEALSQKQEAEMR